MGKETIENFQWKIRHNLAKPDGLGFVMEKLGGEAKLKKSYPEVFKMLHRSGEYEKKLLNGEPTAPIMKYNASDAETYGLVDSVGIRTLNYDVSTTADTLSGMSMVDENKSLVIVGELKDVTHNISLDGFAVTESNSHKIEGRSSIPAASLIKDTEYEFLASSTFYKTVIDQEGNPYYVCETQTTDAVKVIKASSLVKKLIVNDPTPVKHKNAEKTVIYYNNRTGEGCDYYYNNVSYGDYNVEINIDFSGSVELSENIFPDHVDRNKDFTLQLISNGAASFNTAHWNEIKWTVSGEKLEWKFPSNWHEKLQSKQFHAANIVDFYCKMYVVTKSGISIPIVISSYDITHKDPSYKKINPIDIQWGCFAKGTKITMADGSEKVIEEIKKGERVLTRDGNAEVTEIITGQEETLVLIGTGKGNRILLTKDHPVLTEAGWKRADELSAADILLMRKDKDCITELHMQEYHGTVYSIRIDIDNPIIAEGFYVGDFACQNRYLKMTDKKTSPKEDYQQEMEALIEELNREVKVER